MKSPIRRGLKCSCRIIVAISIGNLIGPSWSQSATPDTVLMSATGHCKTFVIAGTKYACNRVTYMSMPATARGSFIVATETGLLSFSGGSDYQPELGSYILNIDSVVKAYNRGDAGRLPASGVCQLKTNKEATIFYRITCDVRSAVGPIRLDFRSDGSNVTVGRVPALRQQSGQ